ncbi:MAG: peptide-methionine (S)-S-oxide reductase [Cyclobacteriaceae bacterium]
MSNLNKIGFGGGCHWCTEGVFQSLKGVTQVDQGWISPDGLDASFSEGVIVTYDSGLITMEVLIEIHLLTHASASEHSMRAKYRSAVYVFDDGQRDQVQGIINAYKSNTGQPIITQVLPMNSFRLNDEAFLNYYQTRPDAPFCTTYIDPKIKSLMRTHGEYLKSK